MKHSIRCEKANPNSKCRCSCGGKLHGIRYKEKETEKPTIDKYIQTNMDNYEKFIKA